jgi:hypothetical protein
MIDSLKQNTIIDMFQCLVYIPLSLLTIKVIKEYSNFENILFNDIVIEPALHIDSENKDL